MRVGQRITIRNSEHLDQKFHGKKAVVKTIVKEGDLDYIVVKNNEFPTTEIRVTLEEIEIDDESNKHLIQKQQGFTGDICKNCQGMRVVRSGTCSTCLDCGTNTGCA